MDKEHEKTFRLVCAADFDPTSYLLIEFNNGIAQSLESILLRLSLTAHTPSIAAVVKNDKIRLTSKTCPSYTQLDWRFTRELRVARRLGFTQATGTDTTLV